MASTGQVTAVTTYSSTAGSDVIVVASATGISTPGELATTSVMPPLLPGALISSNAGTSITMSQAAVETVSNLPLSTGWINVATALAALNG